MFIRDEWKNKSTFHPHSEEQIFSEVSKQISTHSSKNPVLLLDLDSTLYEVAPRTHAIINTWLNQTKVASDTLLDKLRKLKTTEIGYSLLDTFKNIGLVLNEKSDKEAFSELKDFWWSKFFTNEYLHHDKAYTGANAFAKKAHDAGAYIVYLTGREESPMIEGTIKNLIRDSFPWDTGRTSLLMRQSATQTDLEHKALASEKIRQTGKLIASFENEPQNIVALYKSFPDGMHVFMDTVCSDHPAEALHGLYKIKDFSSFKA